MTNHGCFVHPNTTPTDMEELSSLLDLQVAAGTCNRGFKAVGSSVVANDWSAFAGMDTTATELKVVETVFKLTGKDGMQSNMRSALIDNLG